MQINIFVLPAIVAATAILMRFSIAVIDSKRNAVRNMSALFRIFKKNVDKTYDRCRELSAREGMQLIYQEIVTILEQDIAADPMFTELSTSHKEELWVRFDAYLRHKIG